MKKIALFTLTLTAVLASFSSAFASSPSSWSLSSWSPAGACAAGTCCEIKCAEGESVAVLQKRAMTAELAYLVARYVSDASIRSELLRTLKSDPARALESVALAQATFSESDRAAFKRVSEHFDKC